MSTRGSLRAPAPRGSMRSGYELLLSCALITSGGGRRLVAERTSDEVDRLAVRHLPAVAIAGYSPRGRPAARGLLADQAEMGSCARRRRAIRPEASVHGNR